MKFMPQKRYIAAAVAAATLGGGAFAFADTLGLTSQSLGGGHSAVAACSSAVKANYAPSFEATSPGPGYTISKVTLSGLVAACNGLNAAVHVTGGSTDINGTVAIGVANGTANVDVSLASHALAEDVTNVYVTIYG